MSSSTIERMKSSEGGGTGGFDSAVVMANQERISSRNIQNSRKDAFYFNSARSASSVVNHAFATIARCDRHRSIRLSVDCLPRIASVSKIAGLITPPLTAMRKG